jgi:hypothetical protein
MNKGFDFNKVAQKGFKLGGSGAFLVGLGVLALNSFYYGTYALLN